MNIERTCKVTLTRDEVLAALNDYIHEKYRYRYDSEALKASEEVLDAPLPETLTVLWGAPVEKEEPETEENPPERDEPCIYGRGELPPRDSRDEHDRTLGPAH